MVHTIRLVAESIGWLALLTLAAVVSCCVAWELRERRRLRQCTLCLGTFDRAQLLHRKCPGCNRVTRELREAKARR
jgi:hypothetical protein